MYAVILAGGGGTRLWPLSRPDRPKVFLPLLDERSLLQRTVGRLRPLVGPADLYVVSDQRYAGLVREQLPELPAANLLTEPVGRNTGPAIALAALAIERPDEEVMAVFPADHEIADEEAFREAVKAAAEAAAGGRLVTLGIEPDRPETGYGYVVAGAPDTAAQRARPVERFEEKPDADRAAELLASGRAYWNAGIFVWRRDALLDGLRRHAGAILGPLEDCLRSGRPVATAYPSLRPISIDYALLEPASLEGRVGVVPMDVGWSDLGSWSALLDALAGGAAHAARSGSLVVGGQAEDLGSRDTLVHASGGRLVVTIGLRGTIVVDTPDVLLVCSREQAQDVKQIVERLAKRGESGEQ